MKLLGALTAVKNGKKLIALALIFSFIISAGFACADNTVLNVIRVIDTTQPVKLALSFDEATGTTAYDNSGYGNNGTINGATWTTGQYGSALQFDGVDDNVVVANSESLNFSGAFTVSGRIKVNETIGGLQLIIRDGSSATTGNFFIGLEADPTNRLWIQMQDSTGASHTLLNVLPLTATDTWYYFCGGYGYEGDKLFLQVNNQWANSSALSVTRPATNSNIYIGSNTMLNNLFNGTIDEVRLYNRTLDRTTEIKDLYSYYGYVTPTLLGEETVQELDPAPAFFLGNATILPQHIARNGWDSQGRFFAQVYPNTFYWSENGNPEDITLRYSFTNNLSFDYGFYIDCNDNIYVSFNGRFYCSINQGETFSLVTDFNARSFPFWSMTEDTLGNVYVGGYGESGDGAEVFKLPVGNAPMASDSWQDISDPTWNNTNHVHNIRVNPYNNYVYVALGDVNGYDGVYRSKLGDGTDWVQKDADSSFQYIGIVFIDENIYLSSDMPNEWSVRTFVDDGTDTPQSTTLVFNDSARHNIYYMEKDDLTGTIWIFLPPTDAVWGDTVGRVYSSTDGLTWTKRLESPKMQYERWANFSDVPLSQWTFKDGTRHFNSQGVTITEYYNNNAVMLSNDFVSTHIAGKTATFTGTFMDDVGLSHYIFSTNNSGQWVNQTAVAFSSNPQTVEVTLTLNDTAENTVSIRWYANDTASIFGSENWADSGIVTITLTAQSINSIWGIPLIEWQSYQGIPIRDYIKLKDV